MYIGQDILSVLQGTTTAGGETMSELNIMTNEESFLFSEGTYFHSYKKLGAHPACHNGEAGYNFAVWAN